MVAELRHEEAPHDVCFPRLVFEAVHPAVGAIDQGLTFAHDSIPFHPGAEEERFLRDVVLVLARLDTPPTPDTLADVDAHPIVVLQRVVTVIKYQPFDQLDLFFSQHVARDKKRGGGEQ